MIDILQFSNFWLLGFLLLGAFVGFVAGLLGVGGGAVMVPILTTLFLWMDIEPSSIVHLALGTSMTAIVLTSFASAKAHHQHKAIYWSLVKRIGPGIVLGTALGVFIVGRIDAKLLSVFFALFVLIISFRLYRTTRVKNKQLTSPATTDAVQGSNNVQACFPFGAFIGLISALVSIGGGSLTVPYLVHFKVAIHHAIATSSAIGFIISVTGTCMYFLLSSGASGSFSNVPGAVGHVFLPAALSIGLVSLFTAKFGAAMAHNLPADNLKKICSVLLLLLGVNMLIAVFSS